MKPLRICLLLALVWAFSLCVSAQKVKVYAPTTVKVGQQFQVTYVFNTSNVGRASLAALPPGLKLLAGPFEQYSANYQTVNGHITGSETAAYTFIFVATKHGQLGLPAFHATAGHHNVSAPVHKITVVGQDEEEEPAQHQPSGGNQHSGTTAKSKDDDLFITVSASRTRVLEQEPVLVTYKVYTTLTGSITLNPKMPDVKGTHMQEVKLAHQETLNDDTYEGRPCRSAVRCQYLVYPQTTGKIVIPSIVFEGSVQEYDPFYGYNDVRRSITAPSVSIQVDALPAKPKTFGGGVGHFNLSAQPGKTDIKAGDPFTLRLVIGGAGNLKLLRQPTVKFPKDFDSYDTKVTDQTRLTGNDVEGNMVFDYVAVPRKEGKYTIPAVEWTYYDTQSHQYKTLRTQPITLNVAKNNGAAADAADYTAQQKLDIRPINRDEATVRSLSDAFFDSMAYWLTLCLLGAVFVALLLRFHRRALERADLVKMRGKTAGKTAEKRLRKAHRLMERRRTDRFYDAVLKALWGYVSDRLNMKREQLSRDNIAEKLSARGVSDATIDNFIKAIDECEFERYAPGDPAGNMNKTIEAATTAITHIEEALAAVRKSRAQRSGYTVIGLMLFSFLFPLSSILAPAEAMTKENGDREYARGNYQQAIADYRAVLNSDGPSAEVYYNLGNAYYRAKNIPQAILAYERSLQLSPGNSDTRFNLELARTKTIDKIVATPEMFLVTWYRAVVNQASADQWGIVSIVSLALVIALVLLFLFADQMLVRRIGFYGGIFFFLLFAASVLFGFQQQSAVENRRGAIVVSPSVSVRKTPAATAEEAFVIHEGTRVDIEDKTMEQWREIKLADGREGWVMAKQLEEI